ncbi:hypothetical protein M9Y10_018421 [Tritrichomonas musculus]|uniref:VWFA domain-containing protein n=1 Tax=Tritrichomonas musculus TaxID=1915356 RepID=A0ABR2HNJ4_9EUKA
MMILSKTNSIDFLKYWHPLKEEAFVNVTLFGIILVSMIDERTVFQISKVIQTFDVHHSHLARYCRIHQIGNYYMEFFRRRAGIEISGIDLSQNTNDQSYNINQDFVHSPQYERPLLRIVPWKTKNTVSEHYMKHNDHFSKRNLLLIQKSEQNVFESKLNYLNEEEEESERTSDFNNPETNYDQISTNQNKLTIVQVAYSDDEEKNVSEEEEDEVEEEEESPDENVSKKKENKKVYRYNDKNLHSQTVVSGSIDGLFTKFTELNGIKRVLHRIKDMPKDEKLKFSKSQMCIIDHQNELFSTNESEFPIKRLIENSQNLIAKLISYASDTNCPFLFITCNLLFDCSSYISIENKLYNFMILISFSYALSSLEIPFSITIIADSKFRFVLKPFEEEISILVLQRIFDCIFIQRFRTNIADSFHHAIKFLKSPYQERTQRAMFLFSNGIDENLVLAQSWKELLLNNPNNSFGMIFVKSKFLNDEKYSCIQQMWDDFNKVVKNASSFTKLTYINGDINDNTFESIATTFSDVLNRPQYLKYKFEYKNSDILPELNPEFNELSKEAFESIKYDITYNVNEVASVYRKINQRFNESESKFSKLNLEYYKRNTCKMVKSLPDQSFKEEFDQFIHQIVYNNRNSYRPFLEKIFQPNKASEVVLSDTGTDMDITALIFNLINPVPDPLIYLEEKGGMIRYYGISIIIDSSKSCFNSFASFHSYQTIKVLFSALSCIDIPCVDVIIATNSAPIVLSSETPSLKLFNDKSQFWPSLFNCLSEQKSDYCNLESAIHAAYDLRRMRTIDASSCMFVLTDGIFQQEQKTLIKNHIMSCIKCGFSIFGIGIGLYPSGIEDLFPLSVYSPNPNNLLNGLASCFGDDYGDFCDDSIKVLAPEKCSFSSLTDIFDKLIKNDKIIFNDLKKYLQDTQHATDAWSDMYNEEQKGKKVNDEIYNPEGKNTEMFVKDTLKGQKILIVMLYDSRQNLQEKASVAPRFLLEPENANENVCVKKAVEFFGINIVIVQNYEDAIKELTKQTVIGQCDYYATWVLSGLPYDIPLPDGGKQYYVDQFIDCLILFWQNGGSVVLFSEGEPLTFQTNLFLEKIRFANNTRTELRVGGSHEGKKELKADISGKLEEAGYFNKSNVELNKYQRAPLGHNLEIIYEGETISFAPNDKSIYSPFIPFMKDSENGISALFYPGDRDSSNPTGDIIIDCGYTKLFDKMTEKGTFRYIQNIACWTAQCESKRIKGIEPKDFRPKAVIFNLDENQHYDLQKTPDNYDILENKEKDIENLQKLFAIDHSGSVSKNSFYFSEVQSIIDQFYKENDVIMTWGDKTTIVSRSHMQRIIDTKEGNENTYPKVIAEALAENNSIPRDHLILVTDGKVTHSDIEICDTIIGNNNIRFKYVTTYVIGSGGDLSVGTSFSRDCESKTFEIKPNSKRVFIGATEIDFAVLDSVDQINDNNQFKANFESLFNATKQKMMGTPGNENLRNKFESLKERIALSGNLDSESDRKISVLIGMASGTIKNIFDIDTICAMKK